MFSREGSAESVCSHVRAVLSLFVSLSVSQYKIYSVMDLSKGNV